MNRGMHPEQQNLERRFEPFRPAQCRRSGLSRLMFLLAVTLPIVAGDVARAVELMPADSEAEGTRPSNAPEHEQSRTISRDLSMKTLGGRQFWGDLYHFRGWRIQQHVMTGHCRLLDHDDYRHASGTYDDCLNKLNEIRSVQKLKPMDGKVVVLVHGIIRSSKSFSGLAKELKQDGFTVVGFDYPSTRITIPEAADYLRRTIESLEGIDEINFVVHSMGGLVVRSYLANQPDERIRRMVMMGVPNRGAVMADKLKGNLLFKAIMGPAGQQLVSDINGLIPMLPVPQFEFAVIAGGRGDGRGFNPLLDGDDDGTVSVQSARLPGATDFAVVNCLHSFLMWNTEAVKMTRRFLVSGSLRDQGPRHPIPSEDESRSEADSD